MKKQKVKKMKMFQKMIHTDRLEKSFEMKFW
jgi:hypothetical protein